LSVVDGSKYDFIEQVLLKTYLGHGQDVLDVRGSCDNSQLVSCSKDKLVVVWDVTSGSALRKYRGNLNNKKVQLNTCIVGVLS
jgi:WD40 repeat protein